MWRSALLETVLEIRHPETCKPTGKGRSISLHGRPLMGCRKESPKGHILDQVRELSCRKRYCSGSSLRPADTFTPVEVIMGKRTFAEW
jgi:hypothetical protein